MAGLPGGNIPGGVPSFVSAPAGIQPDSTDTTTILRQPTYTPRWQPWTPPGGTYGFVDYSIGFTPTTAPDTTHIIRAPTYTPTWQPWRLENRGFVQSVPLTLQPAAVVVTPTFMPGVIVWSNPRAPQRSVDLLTWTQSLSAPDLLPPFAQDDWPNPVRPRPDIVPYWIAGTNLGLLRPDVNPFSQDDWPNPRAPQRGQDFGASTNLGLLRPDVAPFAQDDWPNPRAAQRGQDFVASTNLGLLRPDVNPFIPHDWANPRLALQPVSDWLAQGIRAVQVPFAQYDWPVTRGPLNLSFYKFTDYISGTTVQIGPPPPIRQYDWPNPWGAKSSIGLLTWTQSPAVPLAAVVDTTHIIRTPTFTPTWQNWQARSYVNWADYYSIQVIPFVSTDQWPNPQAPRRSVDLLTWTQSVTALNLLPAVVVTYEPRAPTFYKYTPQPNRFDWIQGTTLTLRPVGVVQAPLRPLDWPNPRAAIRGPADHIASTNLGVLRPGVNPEINYDWPNPQAARRSVADWIQSAFAALATAPPPPQPFNQTDWPVTRGAVGVHTGFAVGTNQGLLRPELNPFAQRDWQNPRGAVGSHVGFAAAMQFNLLRPDVNPFLPRDLPNPRAPLRSIDLYGWVQALSALVIPPPPPPTFPPNGQYNWPNPAGPQRGIDLFGWSQSPTALTLPETIIPPVEVLQPGGRGVPHTFSRKKWRELQMLIAAEMAAVAKAEELTKRGKREALLQAARAAAAAVDAAEAEGENKRLDKLLVRNALTLRAAIRAASEVKLLRETASAIEQSRAIVQRQQDEEDEMINLLMLS